MFNFRGLLSHVSGHQIPQEKPLFRTPLQPWPHPLEDATNLLLQISLSSPLPLLAESCLLGRSVRIHAFLLSHAGAEGRELLNCKQLYNTLGLGCVARVGGVGRLELNYCFPLEGTKSRPGLRLSFGAEFL